MKINNKAIKLMFEIFDGILDITVILVLSEFVFLGFIYKWNFQEIINELFLILPLFLIPFLYFFKIIFRMKNKNQIQEPLKTSLEKLEKKYKEREKIIKKESKKEIEKIEITKSISLVILDESTFVISLLKKKYKDKNREKVYQLIEEYLSKTLAHHKIILTNEPLYNIINNQELKDNEQNKSIHMYIRVREALKKRNEFFFNSNSHFLDEQRFKEYIGEKNFAEIFNNYAANKG
jgi:hypothetical protein